MRNPLNVAIFATLLMGFGFLCLMMGTNRTYAEIHDPTRPALSTLFIGLGILATISGSGLFLAYGQIRHLTKTTNDANELIVRLADRIKHLEHSREASSDRIEPRIL